MASDVQICNVALIKIGQPSILSLTEDSLEARSCNLLYNDIRQEVLRSHLWNFAIKRVELAQSTDTPVFGYNYKYALPSDCLRVLRMDPEGDSIEFKIEDGYLLTNESQVYIRYVSNVTDPNKFDSSFRETLSTRLAAELAIVVTNDIDKANYYMNMYEIKLGQSTGIGSQEGTPEQITADLWIESRL